MATIPAVVRGSGIRSRFVTASLLPTAAVAFAGTTIDDLVILAALFTARRASGSPRAATIIMGGSDENSRPPLASTVTRITVITFANGADNISVVTPLFCGLQPADSLLTAALFLVLIALWCAMRALVGSHRAVVAALGRISHWLVPVTFIAVGALIVVTSGTPAAIRETL